MKLFECPLNNKNNLKGSGFSRLILLTLLLLGGLCLSLPCPVKAKKYDPSKALGGFKKWYKPIKSFKAYFYQYTFNPLWGEEQKAEGEVYYKKPGRMHWEYRAPEKDIIILNEEGFFWYMPKDNQVLKRKKEDIFKSISPMSILGEDIDIETNFEVTGIEEKEKMELAGEGKENKVVCLVILLKPKKPGTGIATLRLEIKAEDFSLAAIEVEEEAGSRNRIEFDKLNLDTDLSENLFVFTPPPGTKEITPEDFPTP